MSISKLTSQRVVQALYRGPLTAAGIAERLRADEDAQNLQADTIEAALERWEDRGLVARFEPPGSTNGTGTNLWIQVPVFHDDDFGADTVRRFVAHMTVPRNVPELEHELRIDAQTPSLSADTVEALLATLEDRGLVVPLGEPGDAEAAVEAAKADEAAITLPAEKADRLVERLSVPSRAWRSEGEQWVMSQKAFDALQVIA
jgi:hypothetical protein